MANIAVFVERYTIQRAEEMGALMRFAQAAPKLGHRIDVLFRMDTYKIPQYDALFIRSLTDPLNAAYVAARIGELHGLRVIDDPNSILICCDKVNMYSHMMAAGVPIPDTVFLNECELTLERADELLKQLGKPLVLKAPNSSFSLYVERASTPEEIVRVGKRFLRRADRLVVQRFVPSQFDWRVGVLGGEPLYACQYLIPRKHWKVHNYDTDDKRVIEGSVKGITLNAAPPNLLDVAVKAAAAIGNGFYGIDIKQVGDEFLIIEVNDNPTVAAGEEDQKAPHIYDRVIGYLARDWG